MISPITYLEELVHPDLRLLLLVTIRCQRRTLVKLRVIPMLWSYLRIMLEGEIERERGKLFDLLRLVPGWS